MPDDTPEDIFTPFEESPPPPQQVKDTEVPQKTKRGRPPKADSEKKQRKARTVNKPNKPARKKRAVAQVRQPSGLRFTLAESLALMDTLKAEDAAVFEKILGILGGASKKQRMRVVEALSKVFAE